MKKLKIKNTVSAVIINKKGEILLFKKAKHDKFDLEKWNIIVELLPDNIKAEEHLLNMIREKLSDANILLGPINWKIFSTNENLVINDNTFLLELHSENIILNNKHSEYKWIDIKDLDSYDTFEFLKENLHNLGITQKTQAFKLLYTNYKEETKWRFIRPLKYRYDSTLWHPTKQWLLYCFDLEKNENRDYAVSEIKVFIPSNFLD